MDLAENNHGREGDAASRSRISAKRDAGHDLRGMKPRAGDRFRKWRFGPFRGKRVRSAADWTQLGNKKEKEKKKALLTRAGRPKVPLSAGGATAYVRAPTAAFICVLRLVSAWGYPMYSTAEGRL
jgi:hypothetical protein